MKGYDLIGQEAHDLLARLFPICRSITGDGVRKTLSILSEITPLILHEVPSGTQVFDWTIPKEWNIQDACILNEAGERVVDFRENNLHVVSYSTPVDRWMTRGELDQHLFSLEDQPDAIPYVTSYYQERWGFCLRHRDRLALPDGRYHVVIDSELKDGHLTYAEIILPGESEKEILFSTYICHPSMANNELSGPVLAIYLARHLAGRDRRYTYRIVFAPETIGALTYLSRNLVTLQQNVIAGFILTCVGDERAYSCVASRYGDTYADRIINNLLRHKHPDYKRYSYLDRGSDEKQYGSPLVNLPVVAVARSLFRNYPEYHTSLDDLSLVSPEGLQGSYELMRDCINLIERNHHYQIRTVGEPQLGKRGLYPTLSKRGSALAVRAMTNFIAYADGRNDLIAISDWIGIPVWELYPVIDQLMEAELLKIIDAPTTHPSS